MSSSQTRATVKVPSPAPTRSLLARLKSPLASKSRNYNEFYIQSDDAHRQYAPGDIISGSVILKVTKPLRITHLVISLHGYAQVFKNPNTPGDAYKTYCTTLGSGKAKKIGSYFGNGFVSLFEDEVVLCGEGRLAEGVYHFNFELEFPAKGLPSSINFERGTIAYMLTATLTRPTTISPATSCHAPVNLVEVIDIAPVGGLKPRIISLEPISRRGRTKPSRKTPDNMVTDPIPPHSSKGSEAPRTAQSIDHNAVAEEADCPRSPSPSEMSSQSQMSSGGASGTEYGVRSIHTGTDGATRSDKSRAATKGKTITATIHVLKGAFLRGDQIPIKIHVKHTKHVRSLNGIIVTLYRQARVDMHPALPVAPNTKGDKNKTEDYYPKSRTGLGGLSLSSAGSTHTFRKDLSQAFAPLFVDPRTLTAEVKCAVRVPDEAFPTISNVPGAMISFKYYVEVVIDIQGKLTGLDRMVANAGLVVPFGAATMAQDDVSSNMFSTFGGSFVDTDSIRREKGIISSLFEVIIGTKDSERNGKRKQTRIPEPSSPIHNVAPDLSSEPFIAEGHGQDYDHDYYDYYENGQQYYNYNHDPSFYEVPGYEQHGPRGGPSYHAPTQLPYEEEAGLSEKERMQRAEARLLPSQPPGMSSPSSPSPGVQQGIAPSAPILPDDDDLDPTYATAGPSTAQARRPPPFRKPSSTLVLTGTSIAPSMQRRPTGPQDDDNNNNNNNRMTRSGSSTTINAMRPAASASSAKAEADDDTQPLACFPPQSPSLAAGPAPEYEVSSWSSHVQATDDKQEMQRRRLELEQSAPPNELDEEAESSSHGPSAPPLLGTHCIVRLLPSAPVLDDDDEGLVDAVRRGRNVPNSGDDRRRRSEALPEYHR
ncbi:ph-response sensor protein [Pleosporales sp. CAS-2024a]